MFEYVIKSLSYVYIKRIRTPEATQKDKEEAKEKYKEQLIKYEKRLERDIESIWQHVGVKKNKEELALDNIGLFSKQSASDFWIKSKRDSNYWCISWSSWWAWY